VAATAVAREPGSPPDEQLAPRRPAPGDPVPAGATPPSDAAPRPARAALELAGLLIAATTLISALAFYFGWAITSARVAYFGLDSSALGFSTQDYILRSTDALFVPLGAVVVLALAARALHATVTAAIAGAKRLSTVRAIARAGIAAGAVVLAIGLWGAVEPLPVAPGALFTAASPGIGIALLAYCLHVVALVDASGSPGPPPRGAPRLSFGLVGLLVGLSAFWTTAVFAAELGHDRGRTLGANLDRRPAVTVLSAKDLHLAEAGATTRRLAGDDAAYRYRYGGLRLIFRAGGKYFLVPDDWSPSTGTAIVLDDDPSLRFEFRPGSAP